MVPRTMLGLVTFGVLLLASGSAWGQYEEPSSYPVSAVLPATLAKGPHHTIKDPVAADGYMYHFQIESPFGHFDAVGLGALRKLVNELSAINDLRKVSSSEAFVKALGDQAMKPVTFAKNVVTKPGETLTGVPKGVSRLFGNVSNAVSNTPDAAQDSRTNELLQVAAFKREYAARVSVDPYTSNAVLQEELDKLAKASAYGLWTASVATMPIGGGAGAVLSVTGLSQSLNNVLKSEPPARIRTVNEKRLAEMKVPADLAKRYLDHDAYSPRHDLLLVDSLYRLGGAAGRDRFLRAALKADGETEANFFTNTAQMLRGYHERRGKITAITMFEALPVGLTQGGVAVIPLAIDHGVWTQSADRITQHLKSTYRPPGFKGRFEMLVTGTLSPRAKEMLQARGFSVVEQAGSQLEIID